MLADFPGFAYNRALCERSSMRMASANHDHPFLRVWMKTVWVSGLLLLAVHVSPLWANDAAAEAFQEYLDFATYEAGIMVPQQLTKEIFESATFVDTRDLAQYEQEHIPGARHIEWRELVSRREELPADGLVVLYCNTGSLSAQGAFALRVLGQENVVVLQTGLIGWKADAPYRP